MVVSCIICKIKRDIGRKSWFFSYPLHSMSPLGGGGCRSVYCHPLYYGKKTRMVWLLDIEITLKICLAVSTEYRRVTDGQTEGQTSCHGILRAMHTRRAVKTVPMLSNGTILSDLDSPPTQIHDHDIILCSITKMVQDTHNCHYNSRPIGSRRHTWYIKRRHNDDL